MTTPGRRKAAVAPVLFALKLRLYPGRDDDLIAYLQSAPPRLRGQYVLQALHTGQLPSAPTGPPPADDLLDFSQFWQ